MKWRHLYHFPKINRFGLVLFGPCLFLIVEMITFQTAASVLQDIQKEIGTHTSGERVKKEFCSRGKMCRQLNEKICTSQIVFSLCWVFCGQEDACVQSTGQNTLLSPTEKDVFANKQTPAHYLVTVIKSPHKTRIETSLLCDGVCPLIVSEEKYLFWPGIEGDLKTACFQGCHRFLSASPP